MSEAELSAPEIGAPTPSSHHPSPSDFVVPLVPLVPLRPLRWWLKDYYSFIGALPS